MAKSPRDRVATYCPDGPDWGALSSTVMAFFPTDAFAAPECLFQPVDDSDRGKRHFEAAHSQ